MIQCFSFFLFTCYICVIPLLCKVTTIKVNKNLLHLFLTAQDDHRQTFEPALEYFHTDDIIKAKEGDSDDGSTKILY